MPRLRLAVPAITIGTVLLLAGCSAGGAESDDGTLSVVASTDVYGSVAQAIGGDRVDVTSLIDSPSKDPHEYEASARDRLAVSEADVVIENGGGYDPFLDALLTSASDDVVILDAVELSGLEEQGDADFNEHVWYDFGAVEAVATALADALADADPAGAAGYRANATAFAGKIDELQGRVDELRSSLEGTQVAITEPVPLYLLSALGLENVTPADFSESVEEDTDVAPDVLEEVLDLLDGAHARLLADNAQTATAQTDRVRTAAEQAGVPVVDFTETLPEGDDYLGWMTDNVENIAEALGA